MSEAETIEVRPNGRVKFRGRRYRCATGRGGFSFDKREGDGATPAGCFALRSVLYRPDRLSAPETGLPTAALAPTHAWSDDSGRDDYNTLVRLPYAGRHEELWRQDRVYDVIVPLGYNDDPPRPGRGSAVFIHVARSGYAPTEACLAFSLTDLLEILRGCGPDTRACVRPD